MANPTTGLTSPQSEPRCHKVAILFAGGPAPAANAVISTAAVSFLRNGAEVLGVKHGYSRLVQYSASNPMEEGPDYIRITHKVLRRTRNTQGIMIGTARTNPGVHVSHPSHLDNPKLVAPLRAVYEALCSLGVDALVSIGGDDTLKTANKFKLFQERLPEGSPRIPVVHLPKTIDNDYSGIDFTFGYFTAVETIGVQIRNLLSDAEANNSYFLAETMGRSAGWLAYGAAIAGEASLVLSVEDLVLDPNDLAETEESPADQADRPPTAPAATAGGSNSTRIFLRAEKEPVLVPVTSSVRGKRTDAPVHSDEIVMQPYVNPETGLQRMRPVMDLDAVVDYIVETIRLRHDEGKNYGVIVVAEGLAEYLPNDYLKGIPRDEHGHISASAVQLDRRMAKWISRRYQDRYGKKQKVTGVQFGYEARCARPLAFDVLLGSQLGVGAYRALMEEGLDGVMVSCTGQLEIRYVPFEKLVDPETLVTVVRRIPRGSDFHRLARFLETYHRTDR